ncbi:MAG: PepSY-like domain-containing protein [Cyclobacteriaceae bacterium]
MKTKLLFTTALAALILASCSNDEGINIDQIPTEVISDFEGRHPGNSGITWEREGNYYEAEFFENGLEKEIVYDLDGNWIQSECEMSMDDVPAAAIAYIEVNYPGASLDKAEAITRPDGDYVEVEITDGKKEYELLFDLDGNFIEEVIEADNDEDGGDD